MGSVWYRSGAQLRARWRSWVAIGVLAGVFYGSVLAVGVGAQRTSTVVARSIHNKVTPDVFMVPAYSLNGELLDYDTIAAFPEVGEAYNTPIFPNAENFDLASYGDMRGVAHSVRLLEGRLPDPARADEAAADFVARDQRDVHVGDVVTVHLASLEDAEPAPGPVVQLRIVGIVASLGNFASVSGAGLLATAAFGEQYGSLAATNDLFAFVLKRHAADLTDFRRHVSDMTGGKPVLFVEFQNDRRQIDRSFHVQSAAMWILAGFLSFVTLVVLTQAFARLTSTESRDDSVLSALGMSRLERLGTTAVRSVFIAGVATAAAVLLTAVSSTFMPFGRPRLAETAPGIYLPGYLVGAGMALIFILVVLQSVVPSVLVRARGKATRSTTHRWIAAVPSYRAGVGLRFALGSRSSTDAVPVQSGLAGLTVAVIAVVLSLTVSTSLGHLLETPRLYGWGWDALVHLDEASPETSAQLATTPGVDAVGYGGVSALVSLGDTTAELVAMEPSPIHPVMLEGRVPERDNEIAVGRKSLQAAHAHIGSTLTIAIQGQDQPREMQVSGVTVLPVESDVSTLGEGVLITGDGLRNLVPGFAPDVAFVRFAPNADKTDVRQTLVSLAGDDRAVAVPTKPTTLVDFGHVRSLPLILAALLVVFGLATLAHLLVSSVHRRRREIALLRTIGFAGRDLRAVFTWQTVALTLVSVGIGIPLGVVAGRFAWNLLAHQTGFVSQPATAPRAIATIAAGLIALSLVLARVAGHLAAATAASPRYE